MIHYADMRIGKIQLKLQKENIYIYDEIKVRK